MRAQVLILGMPRSGTTWVAKIVDSHPAIAYFHEPDSVFPLTGVPLFAREYTDIAVNKVGQFLEGFPYIDEKCLGKRPFFKKTGLSLFHSELMKYSIMTSKILNKNFIYYPTQQLEKYSALTCFKSIESVGRLKAFLQADSQIKVIFIIRSAFGQINSIFKGSQAKKFDYNDISMSKAELTNLYDAFGHKFSFTLEQVLNFSPLQQYAYRWLTYNEKALYEAKSFSDRVYISNYDRLCDTPIEGSKQLFQFIGLDFHPQSEDFLRQSNNNHNNDYYSVVKDANKAKSAWQKDFTKEQIEEISEVIRNTESSALFET